MTARSLQSEMEQAASRMRSIHFEWLKALGVPMAKLGELSGKQYTVGAARVEYRDNGSFTPSPDGVPVCLVAVVDPHAFGEAGISDIVAFRSSDPSRWWRRTGSAYALGEHLLDLPDPVRVVRTPCDWLAVGGEAVCFLDWSVKSPAWRVVRSGPELQFPDEVLLEQASALVSAAAQPPMKVAA